MEKLRAELEKRKAERERRMEKFNRDYDAMMQKFDRLQEELSIQSSLVKGDRADETRHGGALLADLIAKYKNIVFGDMDHSAEEIPLFIASQMRNLRKSGVEAIFLEFQEENSHHIEEHPNYSQTRVSYQHIASHNYLAQMAKEAGIRVFYMDKPLESEAAKRGAELYFDATEAIKTHGRNSEEAKAAMAQLTGPDYDAFLKERDDVNQKWVDFIAAKTAEHQLGSWVAIGGNRHTAGTHNFDEMVRSHPSLGTCVQVDLCPLNVGGFKSLPGNGKPGFPDYILGIPDLPDALVKHIGFQLFEHLVKTGQWETIGTNMELQQQILSMPNANYLAMVKNSDTANSELYKTGNVAAIQMIRESGLSAEAMDYPPEMLLRINRIAQLFQSAIYGTYYATNFMAAQEAPEPPVSAEDAVERVRLRRLGINNPKYFGFEYPFEGVAPEWSFDSSDWPVSAADDIRNAPGKKSMEEIMAQVKTMQSLILRAQKAYLQEDITRALEATREALELSYYNMATLGAQSALDGAYSQLQEEILQRKGRWKAAKLLEDAICFDDWTSFGFIRHATDIDHPDIAALEEQRWKKFHQMRDTLAEDKPQEALAQLQELKGLASKQLELAQQAGLPENPCGAPLKKPEASQKECDAFEVRLEAYARQKAMQGSGAGHER